MTFFKPLNPWLRGVPFKTINPKQKQLHFLSPILGERGNACRDAKKEFEALEKIRTRRTELRAEKELGEKEKEELEKLENEVDDEKEQESLIHFLIRSLKQQYTIAFDVPEEKKRNAEQGESEKMWIETFSDCFCEDDLEAILSSIRVGKEISRGEMYDMARDMSEKNFLERSGQS